MTEVEASGVCKTRVISYTGQSMATLVPSEHCLCGHGVHPRVTHQSLGSTVMSAIRSEADLVGSLRRCSASRRESRSSRLDG